MFSVKKAVMFRHSVVWMQLFIIVYIWVVCNKSELFLSSTFRRDFRLSVCFADLESPSGALGKPPTTPRTTSLRTRLQSLSPKVSSSCGKNAHSHKTSVHITVSKKKKKKMWIVHRIQIELQTTDFYKWFSLIVCDLDCACILHLHWHIL